MLSAERSQEAAVPSPGLNMEHGFLRKIEENQIQRHYQGTQKLLLQRMAICDCCKF